MHVTDAAIAEVFERGFTVVEGFLDAQRLAKARAALWAIVPPPEAYFADPDKHGRYARGPFAGIHHFPFRSRGLDQIAYHPDLVDAAERFCGTTDIEIYKIELWAKYAGATNYEQALHRDFGNHSLVVPSLDGSNPQMTVFILLSDVTALDGPTKVVPLEHSRHVPLIPFFVDAPERFAGHEVAITAPAGSMLIYKTDVLHRGTDFGAAGRSRFAMLVDYQARGCRWTGRQAWPNHAIAPGWTEAVVAMTPRERDLFGWPPPGSAYWTAQTLRDTSARYPGMDMSAYTPRPQ